MARRRERRGESEGSPPTSRTASTELPQSEVGRLDRAERSPAESRGSSPIRRFAVAGIVALLILATLATFHEVTSNGFVRFDDDDYVAENPHVQLGLTREAVEWAFTTTDVANWHPVTWVSHMLDVQLFGLDAGKHHRTSLLLHALNAALLFLLLERMTGALWRSALVAALFALHPLHVESVAWIAERKDLLSTSFWILTLWAWLSFLRSRRTGWYLLALLLFALGLMAKPMLVTLPFTLLLLDVWPLGRLRLPLRGRAGASWRLLSEKIPFFALTTVFCGVTFAVQRSGGAVRTLEAFPLTTRLTNAVWAYGAYLLKGVWPSGLCVFYPVPAAGHPAWQIVLAAIVLLGASAGAAWLARRRPEMLVGWLWFLGTLVPVIGIVQVGSQAMADRYTYVPSIGLFVAAVWGIGEGLGRTAVGRVVASAAAGPLLLVLASASCAQTRYWASSTPLFEHALAVTVDNHLAHNNLGSVLFEEGRRDEAISHFREAIRILPSYSQAHDNLGAALVKAGRLEEASEQYREALQGKSEDPGLNARMATLLVMLDRSVEAGGFLEQALAHEADTFDSQYGLGMALQAIGRLPEAQEHCLRALRMKPESALALTCTGQVLGRMGRLPEAIEDLESALRADPKSLEALLNLGVALDHQGRTEEALASLRRAIEIDPDSPAALKTIGMALGRLNRFSEAIPYLERAVAGDARDVETRYALGRALALERRLPEAREQFRAAAALRPGDPEPRTALENVEKALQRGGRR
jgi:tetratricopeptide (TPR) repeat protein